MNAEILLQGSRLVGYTLKIVLPLSWLCQFPSNCPLQVAGKPLGPAWGNLYNQDTRAESRSFSNLPEAKGNIAQIRVQLKQAFLLLENPDAIDEHYTLILTPRPQGDPQ